MIIQVKKALIEPSRRTHARTKTLAGHFRPTECDPRTHSFPLAPPFPILHLQLLPCILLQIHRFLSFPTHSDHPRSTQPTPSSDLRALPSLLAFFLAVARVIFRRQIGLHLRLLLPRSCIIRRLYRPFLLCRPIEFQLQHIGQLASGRLLELDRLYHLHLWAYSGHFCARFDPSFWMPSLATSCCAPTHFGAPRCFLRLCSLLLSFSQHLL